MSAGVTQRRSFTLIELLVVLGIIAILLALLFPAIDKVKENAKRTRARTEVRQLALSWNSYLNDYRTWFPSPGGGEPLAASIRIMTNVAVRILSGIDTLNNRRGINFYEFPTNALLPNASFCDPWGMAYQVALDANYDNSVDTTPWPAGHGIIPRNVAVWSKGKQNGQPGTGTIDVNSDDIKSW